MDVWAEGMQEITAIPFSHTAFSLCWWWNDAYTDYDHTKHPSLSQTTILPKKFSPRSPPSQQARGSLLKRMASLFGRHLNRATNNSHMRWISLSVYCGIMTVNFLCGSLDPMSVRELLVHMLSATRLGEKLAACTSAVSYQAKSW